MVVAGSVYVVSDLAYRTARFGSDAGPHPFRMVLPADLAGRMAQFGSDARLEFDGPILLAMLVVNAGILATIILVVLRQARRRPPSATNLDHPRGGPPTMLDKLEMASQVIMHPNSALAALRDDGHRYFRPSIAVMLLTSIVGVGLGSTIPAIAGQQTMNAVAIFGLTILGVVANAGTIYLIGRVLGGNKSWRKVLTVLFYVNIVEIPAAAVLSTSSILPPGLLSLVMVAAVFAWVVIIYVKAVKVLNGFSTARAFGILVLSGIAQVAWIIPVALLYLWTVRFELPVMQAPLQ